LCFGGYVDAMIVKWKAETGGKIAGEGEIGVGLFTAEAVMQVGGVENEAKFGAEGGECAQEGNGVRATGQAYSQAQAGAKQCGLDVKS
jgi:hypothetical protein